MDTLAHYTIKYVLLQFPNKYNNNLSIRSGAVDGGEKPKAQLLKSKNPG